VNVHPRKLEIRFANEQEIFRNIYHSIEDTLKKVSLLSYETSPSNVEKEVIPQYYTGSGTKFKSYSPYKNTSPNPNQ